MSSGHPSISVVIPVFNGERYITAAIDSVLHQSRGRFEVIVVDDGSSDQTGSIVKRYAGPVHYEYQRNAGPSSARNRGIERATGEFVAFLDADDLWQQDKTAVQLGRFSERPDLAGCASHVQNFLSDDSQIAPADSQTHPTLQQALVVLGSTLIVRRSLFDAVGMLNVEYWHRDLHDLIVRAGDRGLPIDILPDVLARRRIHSTNMSHTRSGADQMELIAITRARHARRRAAGL